MTDWQDHHMSRAKWMLQEANRLLAARKKIERPPTPVTMDAEPPSDEERRHAKRNEWKVGAAEALVKRLAKRDDRGNDSSEVD